jgi:hypothetical protein
MIIDCVVSASNMEKMYYDFIPMFIKSWKILYPNIDVKIILINDFIPSELIEYENNIICFNPIPNISTALTAQIIRLFYPCILKNYENGILISDIDMIPMNNKYYSKPIELIPNDKFICYRDVLMKTDKQIAMCYNIATSDTWSKIFDIYTIDDIINSIIKFNLHYNTNWFTDQFVLYNYVMKFKEKYNNIVILNDTITNFLRLDRINFPNINNCIQNIHKQLYTDYHALRPYNNFKTINDKILTELQNTFSK